VEFMENTLAVSLDSAVPDESAAARCKFRLEPRRKRLVTPDPIEALERIDGEVDGLT
jgi:hypothetical protein